MASTRQPKQNTLRLKSIRRDTNQDRQQQPAFKIDLAAHCMHMNICVLLLVILPTIKVRYLTQHYYAKKDEQLEQVRVVSHA